MRFERSAAFGLVMALSACSDDALDLPRLHFESERARIGVGLGLSPLCAADLARIDARVEFVEERLGVKRDAPLEIYIGGFPDDYCEPGRIGCYVRDDDIIFTYAESLDHEIVHAVAREIDFPSLFWSEGAAELLSGQTTRRDPNRTLHPEDLDAESLMTYISASHFSRFLVETRGWDAYVRAAQGESLEDVYGEDAASLTEAYARDAPYAYPPFDPCPYPDLPEIDAGVWQEEVVISCDAPTATQFEWVIHSTTPGPAIVRRVALEAGTYAFELDGGFEYIALGCHTEELPETRAAPSNGDLYNEVDFPGSGTAFPAIGTQLLTLTAGTYRIAVPGLTTQDVTATLTITQVE